MTVPTDKAHIDEVPLTESERNALRAYLARTEVRMSTMHRIVLAFVGGAGLLLLIPVFLRDVVDGILQILLSHVTSGYFDTTPLGWILMFTMVGALSYPFILSLAIPLYGVYLMIKDVVHFYFTIYMPGFPSSLLNPTFSLSALMFSPDESPRVKRAIMEFQYHHHQSDFMMPFSEGRRELYFDKLAQYTKDEIIPSTRRMEAIKDSLPADADPHVVAQMNVAFGIARGLDRSLIEEAAWAEMALTRNIIYLRRMILRYMKTFLMFIWTTIVTFVTLPFLKDTRFPLFVMLALVYLVWSLAVMPLIKQPISWIYRHRYGDVTFEHVDTQLSMMERQVQPYCNGAILASFIGLVLAVMGLII